MDWVIVLGVLLLLGVLVWRRDRRGSRGGYADPAEKARDEQQRFESSMEARRNQGDSGGGVGF